MPSWKKVITSGSSAHLSHVTASANISGSSTSTGSFGRVTTNKITKANPYPRDVIEFGNYDRVYINKESDSINAGLSVYNANSAANDAGLSVYQGDGDTPAIVTAGANASISGSSTSTGSFGGVYSAGVSRFAGYVGIGTTSPDSPLEIASGNDPLLNLNKTGGGNAALHFEHAGTDKGYIYVDTSMNMHFGNTSVNPTFEITSAGTGIFAQNIQLSNGQQLQWVDANNAIFGHACSDSVSYTHHTLTTKRIV